jgi:hypothetical protein
VTHDDEQLLARPVGWWLKEADARLNAAFDRALDGSGVDRRGWQVLTTLSGGPTTREALVASLASFDSPAVIRGVLESLMARGWIQEEARELRLTSSGAETQASLAPAVGEVRRQLQRALPENDYVALIRLLARLADAF